MIIAISFAFVVLTISTLNILVATIAVISITGIILCVLGVMKLCGWEFGVVESIGCVILIGFSVDYVVHLANHYVESTFPGRFKRMEDSLKQIGISVLGGAITTLGAGFFLFFCTIVFFTKFAILITTTIIFSLLFSTLFFSALSHIIGPQNKTGDLRPLLWKCRRQQIPEAPKPVGNLEKMKSYTQTHMYTDPQKERKFLR